MLDRQVGVGQARRRRGARPCRVGPADAGLGQAACSTGAQARHGRVGADPVRARSRPPRAVPSSRAVRRATSATSVLLLPASMARTRRRRRCRRSQAHGRWSRLWAISRSVRPSARSTWPTSGCASSASKTRSPAAVQGGLERQVLVRRDVRDQPGVQRLERRDRQRLHARRGRPRPGTSMTASSGRNGRVPSLRTLTTWVVGRGRCRAATPTSCDGGLGVERAAALLEQLRLRRRASGRRTARSSSRSISATSRGPRRRDALLARPPRRGRRSSAGSTTARRRAAQQARPGSSTSVGDLVDVRRRAAPGSRSTPSTQRRPLPGQVVEPDVVELHRLGLDAEQPGEPALEADRDVAQPDRPVARPASSARVTMPTGLVKSMIQASGRGRGARARRCRARPAPSAAPSRARRRRWSPGRRSRTPAARSRPGCARPGRRPAAAAARRRRRRAPASRSVGRGQPAGWPVPGEDPPGRAPPTSSSRSAVGVDQHQLVDRQHVAQPGEAVDQLRGVRRPPPTTAIFMRSSLDPGQRDALDEGLLGEEEEHDHRSHHQQRSRPWSGSSWCGGRS